MKFKKELPLPPGAKNQQCVKNFSMKVYLTGNKCYLRLFGRLLAVYKIQGADDKLGETLWNYSNQ